MSNPDGSTEVSKRGDVTSNCQEILVLKEVESALVGLKHGEILITVRRGKVVEIERISRQRPEFGS